jgi:hypothetical protein
VVAGVPVALGAEAASVVPVESEEVVAVASAAEAFSDDPGPIRIAETNPPHKLFD